MKPYEADGNHLRSAELAFGDACAVLLAREYLCEQVAAVEPRKMQP